MGYTKISQREAREWKRRALAAEQLNNVSAGTPGRRARIGSTTLDSEAVKMRDVGLALGGRERWERFGNEYVLFVYLPLAKANG